MEFEGEFVVILTVYVLPSLSLPPDNVTHKEFKIAPIVVQFLVLNMYRVI